MEVVTPLSKCISSKPLFTGGGWWGRSKGRSKINEEKAHFKRDVGGNRGQGGL